MQTSREFRGFTLIEVVAGFLLLAAGLTPFLQVFLESQHRIRADHATNLARIQASELLEQVLSMPPDLLPPGDLELGTREGSLVEGAKLGPSGSTVLHMDPLPEGVDGRLRLDAVGGHLTRRLRVTMVRSRARRLPLDLEVSTLVSAGAGR